VMRDGAATGLLLLSVFGSARQWRKDETEFAESVAAVIGGVLEERARSRAESRLRDIMEDSLSGLPDRDYLRQRAAELFPRLSARANSLAAFVVELEDFGDVLDRHGQLIADELLKAAALRMKSAVRRDDLLVRLDGNAFLILARDLGDAQVVEDIAQQISDSMRNAFSLQGRLLRISANLGIARYPEDGTELETLLKKAGAARYQAKAADHAQPRSAGATPADIRDESPTAQLRRAIEQRELRHYYQPQIDLKSGRVRGVEALLRWQHPQHGLLLPASFLPLAEQGGEIQALSAWALDDACRQAAGWNALGIDGFAVALKLSAAQLADPRLLPALGAAMRRNGLHPHQVECEIKEAVLRSADAALHARIRQLAEMEVALSIDEFSGAGLDELQRRYPVHKVKIEAAAAGGMQEADASDAGDVADAAIADAHALGLEVVAKGVETSQQLEYLRARGCDIGQGYYFTQPLTADQFEKWLTRH
jgi:diguanylate cyclase (GGDEF)-like protein